MTSLGEGVSKLGDVTQKVPLVGAGVSAARREAIEGGESISMFPAVVADAARPAARAQRDRRAVARRRVDRAIVGWQLRTNDTPNFRARRRAHPRRDQQGPGRDR